MPAPVICFSPWPSMAMVASGLVGGNCLFSEPTFQAYDLSSNSCFSIFGSILCGECHSLASQYYLEYMLLILVVVTF